LFSVSTLAADVVTGGGASAVKAGVRAASIAARVSAKLGTSLAHNSYRTMRVLGHVANSGIRNIASLASHSAAVAIRSQADNVSRTAINMLDNAAGNSLQNTLLPILDDGAYFLRNAGCFIAGTLVSLSSLPSEQNVFDTIFAQGHFSREISGKIDFLDNSVQDTATLADTSIQLSIENVPLGARVATKNPKPWDFDTTFAEPQAKSWLKLSFTIERFDGVWIDADILRPADWVAKHDLQLNSHLPLFLPELQVHGVARITAVNPCPPISKGEGSVITGSFVTREVHVIVHAKLRGADGTTTTLSGTPIHPIWSLDRQNWVPLGELQPNERLAGARGNVTVETLSFDHKCQSVYNIEVHGQHVYQVSELGVLVHNAAPGRCSINLSRASIDEAIEQGELRIVSAARAGVSRPPRHHLFAQRLFGTTQSTKQWFSKRGINIDSITIEITQGHHQAIHKWVGSAGWNRILKDRLLRTEMGLEDGQVLTAKEIWKQGYRLLREAGIRDARFIPYKG
jgi:Pretoxin HINT domain